MFCLANGEFARGASWNFRSLIDEFQPWNDIESNWFEVIFVEWLQSHELLEKKRRNQSKRWRNRLLPLKTRRSSFLPTFDLFQYFVLVHRLNVRHTHKLAGNRTINHKFFHESHLTARKKFLKLVFSLSSEHVMLTHHGCCDSINMQWHILWSFLLKYSSEHDNDFTFKNSHVVFFW